MNSLDTRVVRGPDRRVREKIDVDHQLAGHQALQLQLGPEPALDQTLHVSVSVFDFRVRIDGPEAVALHLDDHRYFKGPLLPVGQNHHVGDFPDRHSPEDHRGADAEPFYRSFEKGHKAVLLCQNFAGAEYDDGRHRERQPRDHKRADQLLVCRFAHNGPSFNFPPASKTGARWGRCYRPAASWGRPGRSWFWSPGPGKPNCCRWRKCWPARG